ncbi:MAG: hypothetical protein II625_10560, partial [Bacilli bacterium]|nr:hypothetical protein [Bacilli bacterium]
GVEKEEKVNLYLFHSADCSHCAAEIKWLSEIEDQYSEYLNVYKYEVTYDEANSKLMDQVVSKMKLSNQSLPLTIIGDKTFNGYSDTTASLIENQIKEYAELESNPNEIKIPILGNINMKKVSIPLVAVVLGFIDGFNPCAMWILLFLINMFFGMKDRKKAWVLGMTFLLVSGLVYFLSMLGINFVLGIATIKWMKIAIALFILVAGILNMRKYFKIRKEEAGCTVVDSKKRKKLVTKMKKIMNSKTFFLAMLGIITLAVSVNLIELACSLGFPLIFTEILTINNIKGISRIIFLLIYIFFYMIDDMVVFAISMITVEATGITNKYNKLCTLISAIIMIAIGILLLVKPNWLMLNF